MATGCIVSLVMSRNLGAVVCVCSLLAAACSPAEPAPSGCLTPHDRTAEVNDLTVATFPEPTWTMASDEATFSSPKLIDLNQDGVLDLVQGFGQDTLGERKSSVIATDGATGEELWRSSGHEDLIGTAQFASLTADETADVVIGGRRGALLALDGQTGELLWRFDDQDGRWFNFYTSQFVDDQNGDGTVDLVAVNGGLSFDEPREGGGVPDPDRRNIGTTFLISGADGSVISSVVAPDRREQYMSAIVVPADAEGGLARKEALATGAVDLILGTGGETLPGSLWRLPLNDLLAENPSAATELASGGEKGIIAAPSFADLTGDCVLDAVVQAFGGRLSAVDGATNGELWGLENPGFETYSSPTLGYFVGDDEVADVFVGLAAGIWPQYTSSDYLLLDGKTGEVVWRQTMGTFAPSGFVAVDLNQDGRDEVIFGVNDLARNTHQLRLLDTARGQVHDLGRPLPQTTFSAPWIGDIDGDGRLNLIVTESAYQSSGSAKVHRFDLPWKVPTAISWGGYLGTSTTGVLENRTEPSG